MTHPSAFTRWLIATLAVVLGSVVQADSGPDAQRLDLAFPRSSLQIATPDARLHSFDIWVADTDPRRQRGLMFVKEMDENTGMLFIYPKSQLVAMWMKNTYVSLDILFVRADGRIEHIVRNTEPLSLKTIECKTPVAAVIELKAGTADKLKIGPGARVQHEIFAAAE
jgi:uncharacterized protein